MPFYKAREKVKLNGTLVGHEDATNYIQGTNVTLTIVDDPANGEVDLTIASSGGGGAGGHTIQEGSVALTDRGNLNFVSGFDLSDDGVNDQTDVALDLSEVAGAGELSWAGNTPTVNAAHSGSAHHAQSHAHNGADGSGTVAHSALTGTTANDHHTQSHNHSAAGDGTSLSPATLILPSAAAPAQTTEAQVVWDSDDDKLTVGTGAGRKTLLNVGDAVVATDPIWDAKGDLVVATAADTAARLAVGANNFHTLLVPNSSSASGLAWVPWIVRKAADETVTSNTLQNDDELLWAVAANEVWWFVGRIRISTGETPDFKCTWSVPANATMEWWFLSGTNISNTLLATLTGTAANNSPLGAASVLSVEGKAGQNQLLTIAGYVFVGDTAGNATFRWAQNTDTPASNTSVLANSFFDLRRLA